MSAPPPRDPPPDGGEDPPLREGFRSGVVVVVLEDLPGARTAPDLLTHARENGLGELAELVTELPAEPSIARDRVDRLVGREERARARNPARTARSLSLYWRVDALRFDGDLVELARRVSEFDGVDLAYAEQAVVPPPVRDEQRPGPDGGAAATARATGAVTLMAQGHLDAAPDGVGARAVWGRDGGTGSGVRVVDVEQGWADTHPALATFAYVADPPRANRGGVHAVHGAGVVAVVAAAAGVPVLGVGGDLQVLGCSHWDGVTGRGYNVEAAVEQALDLVDPDGGDVLLLEVQRHDTDGTDLPTETQQADFDVITLARDLGVVVVQSAGNGNRSLDTWSDPVTGRTLATDSGAVMVGACASATDGAGHPRWTTAVSGSNFGARIDCHAWGENVTTATVVAGAPDYATGFGGTSSAAAIVAGVAAVAQALHRAHWGTRLTPPVLRHLLRTLGTPQSPPGAADPIGGLPDLERIAVAVAG